MTVIRRLPASEFRPRLPELADLLHACVHGGASVSFVLPFSVAAAEAFWRGKVAPAVEAGGTVVLIAEAEGRIVGTVQVDTDTPPNQPHRAEIRKLLVHPDYRRRGLGRDLMIDAEARARDAGRWLLTLDTLTGDNGERLYAALGYSTAGTIPDFCIDTIDGGLHGTTLMYKRIEAGERGATA